MSSFTEQESLAVIQEMLAKSRKNTKDTSTYSLIWGWVILLSVVVEFILLYFNVEWHYAIWLPSTLFGIIATVLTMRRQQKIQRTTTHFDRAVKSIWSGFGILMGLLMIGGLSLGLSWSEIYVGIIALMGTTTFVSGRILEVAALRWGGLASIALCLICLYMAWYQSFEVMLLCIGLSMVLSNLIPAYFLKRTIS